MRRLLWIVPSAIAVALAGYFLGKPATAPADAIQPTPANLPIPPWAMQQALKPEPIRLNTAPSSPELPVTQIVLYSSGVGFFQREGYVDGNARVDLSFPVQDVNDLLKSLVLQDEGGGRVSTVGYDSHDPIDKTLNGFAIQLTNNPTHANVLYQARGEKVEVTLSGKSSNYNSDGNYLTPALVLQGTIMGVETKQPASKEGVVVEVLNLLCADGIRTVPLAEVQRVKFLNPALETELAKALDVLARAHDKQKKHVSLAFEGNGLRSVKVGYVVETPLFRTSYRLLIGKDGKLAVQGWALVENPSNDDWKNVRMSLVSGRPISFKMDLYNPLYVPRPVVQQELYTSVRPPVHNGAIASAQNADRSMSTAPKYQDLQPPMAVYSAAAQLPASPPAPSPQTASGFVHNNTGPLGNATGRYVDINSPMHFAAVDTATATNLGATFEYAIDQPVTIPRQKSALLPIVNGGLEGDKVSVYSPGAHAKYPLLALRFKNTTGVHLMAGPVAVFEGSNYCGDAQLPDIQPNEERLVSYALDLGTEVEAIAGDQNDQAVSVRLHNGLLTMTKNWRETKTYTIKNRSPHDRVVIVEHRFRPDYKLVSKQEPKERSQSVYRFEVKVAAGKTGTLEVAEENKYDSHSNLSNLAATNTHVIRYLVKCDLSNAKVKTALEKVLEVHEKAAKTANAVSGLEKQLADITADQARLRANLKEMPQNAAAYKRYLEKFDSQETTIEKLQTQISELREQAQKQQQDCKAYLNGLDLKATIQNAPPGAVPQPGGPAVDARYPTQELQAMPRKQ
ncbi:MAG TPA: DUF4139 domain-containing protein [Gemmataceae bacterium]|nr:DUF4139 domain-containing protein [Gemmataceae bacterium]